MQHTRVQAPFKVAGIAVQTTNENGQAMEDLGQLWGRFFAENIQQAIPNKEGDDIYAIYTKYETDYTGPYTAIIGCKVSSLDRLPEKLVGLEIEGGQYLRTIAKGKMPDAVGNTWQEIWKQDKTLNRAYTADFEVWGEKSQDPVTPEVAIYIAVG